MQPFEHGPSVVQTRLQPSPRPPRRRLAHIGDVDHVAVDPEPPWLRRPMAYLVGSAASTSMATSPPSSVSGFWPFQTSPPRPRRRDRGSGRRRGRTGSCRRCDSEPADRPGARPLAGRVGRSGPENVNLRRRRCLPRYPNNGDRTVPDPWGGAPSRATPAPHCRAHSLQNVEHRLGCDSLPSVVEPEAPSFVIT